MAPQADSNSDRWNKIGKKWEGLGGDVSHLKKAVDEGKNKKKVLGIDGYSNIDAAKGGKAATTTAGAIEGVCALTGVGAAACLPYAAGAAGVIGSMAALLPDSSVAKQNFPPPSPSSTPPPGVGQSVWDDTTGKSDTKDTSSSAKSSKTIYWIAGGATIAIIVIAGIIIHNKSKKSGTVA